MMDISFEKKIKLYYEEHINMLIKNPNLPLFLLNEISHNPDLVQGIRETLRYSEMRDVIYRQHSKELRKFGIKKDELPQLMVTIVSMAIFPFAARNVMKMMMEQLGETRNFNSFMQARKEFASDFVITALKNRNK